MSFRTEKNRVREVSTDRGELVENLQVHRWQFGQKTVAL